MLLVVIAKMNTANRTISLLWAVAVLIVTNAATFDYIDRSVDAIV